MTTRTKALRGAAAVAITAVLGTACPSITAMAQEVGEDALADRNAPDTILVTARKKAETLLEAPVAVTAFGEDQIENLQILSVDDIARFTPGLSFSKAFGRSTERPVIRGQSNVLAGVQFGVESGTAYFVDGVYFPGSIQNIDPADLQRVEVIRGPQSALYGRNTYAGAINFITKGGSDVFEGEARVRAGTYNTYDASLTMAGPLAEGLSGRVSLRAYGYDGDFTNTVTLEQVGDESTLSASGVLDWEPTERFSSRLRVSYTEDDDGPLPIFLQDASANNCAPGYRSLANHFFVPGFEGVPFPRPAYSNQNQYYCGVIEPGDVALNTGPDADGIPNVIPGALPGTNFIPFYGLGDGTAFDGLEREQLWVSLTSGYEFDGGYSLDLLAGYRDETLKTGFDSDHSPVNWFIAGPNAEPFFANTNRDDIEEYQFELRLSSPQDSRLRFMLGLFYYDQDILDSDITFADLSGANTPIGTRTVENQAIFGLVEYDFTDDLSLTVEARYAEEVKTDSTATIAEAEFDNFTPRVTLAYDLPRGGNVYGIFAQGVKPGGLNGDVGEEVGFPTFEQEESNNYEIGLKTPVFGSDWFFTGAAYFIEATDVQLTTALGTPSGALNSVATNQGSGEIMGVELELSGNFTDNLSAFATYAWTDAEFTDGCDPDEWTLTSGGGVLTDPAARTGTDFSDQFPGAGPASCSIAGRQFPLTSEHQASAFLRYDMPAVGPFGSDFFASGDLTYESTKFVQVHNRAETGDAVLLGGRLGFETEAWTFNVWGLNITDEDTIAIATRWLQTPYFFAGINPVPDGASTSAPRAFFGSLRRQAQYGVEFRYRF